MRDPLSHVPIRYKLPLGFLAVCVVAFGIGGVVLTTTARDALESQIERRLDERAVAMVLVVERHLELHVRRVEDFASDGFIRTQVVALDAARPGVGDGGADLVRHLELNKLPLAEAFVGAVVHGADGRVLVALPPSDVGREDARAVAASEIGPLRAATAAHPYPTFRIASPLWGIKERTRIGTLELVVRADAWIRGMRELEQLPALPLRTARLVDPGGVQLDLVRLPPGAADVQAAPYHRRLAQTGWTLELDIDRGVAMAPAEALARQYVLVGGLLLALTALVMFFPLRFLLKPLSGFAEAARRIAGGDFGARVQAESGDEIGELAKAFNIMAAGVEDRTRRLEGAAETLRGREQEIRLERNRLDAVIRSMEDGLFILDANGRVTLTNAAARPLLAALESEASQRLECAHLDQPAPGCLACLAEVDRGQQACVVERGGRIYEIHTTSLPAAPGARPSRLCVSRDVTERIARQETQAHQERMAVLGEVAAVMAHELNNPLAAISMFGEMLEEERGNEERAKECTAVIRRNAAACKRTISGLLDLAARGRLDVGPFDLHDLLDEVRTLLRPLAERARVAIQLEPLAKDAELLGDEVRIRQVFINLVMNGLQACPQGGSICIATADAEGAIEVEVRDTGAGIPPEVVDRVFEPFFTTKGAGMGTGLGLPTSRRIVEEHGGTLTLARSGPGGTVFRVRLVRKPRHRAWEAQARRAADVVSTSREDPTG